MSNTFKPGDRVRRISHNFRNVKVGEEYNVSRVHGAYGLELEGLGNGEQNSYSTSCFELATPTPVEFQKGDRVRATAKEGDDFAEFTVANNYGDGLDSEYNYFSPGFYDFELLSRPKPTNQEVWDSFPIGQLFYFGDADPTYEKVKVTAEKFYNPRVDHVDYVESYLTFGIVPIND